MPEMTMNMMPPLDTDDAPPNSSAIRDRLEDP